ncbi:MAG: hypothetical protein J5486_09645, partial [Bacteroidaceae bacterium]|nr:hypothetical protein [Bacteroidaceae bacterium]
RQASALSPTSFRFHLTMDTLVFDCTLAAIRPRWGLAPVRLCPCRANKREGVPNVAHPLWDLTCNE